MKKLFLILLLFLATSCSVTRTYDVFQRYYPSENEKIALKDIYTNLESHSLDSIPLTLWITFIGENDLGGYIIQRTLISNEEKGLWKFIYTDHFSKDTTFLEFRILLTTKDRKLQRKFR